MLEIGLSDSKTRKKQTLKDKFMARIIGWWVWGDMLEISFPRQLLYLSPAA